MKNGPENFSSFFSHSRPKTSVFSIGKHAGEEILTLCRFSSVVRRGNGGMKSDWIYLTMAPIRMKEFPWLWIERKLSSPQLDLVAILMLRGLPKTRLSPRLTGKSTLLCFRFALMSSVKPIASNDRIIVKDFDVNKFSAQTCSRKPWMASSPGKQRVKLKCFLSSRLQRY